MIILRCFRKDRVNFAIKNYVKAILGQDFITSKPVSLTDIYEESSFNQPIIFVLSPGVDPTEVLNRFAELKGKVVASISLGQGQGDKAKRIIQEGAEKGDWCFLGNCHLSVNLLPELEGIMEEVFKSKKINK